MHHLEGARQAQWLEEPLHLEIQPGSTGMLLTNSSQGLSEASSREKQKIQTTKEKQSTPPHPEFPNKAITHPYSHPWLQTQNQCAASAALGCCLITLHIFSARTTLLIV